MLNIPKDQLPEEWHNEERITVLYSPLRSGKVNPKDWDTKITSWQNIIYLYCLNNKFYTFTSTDLIKKFIRNGRTPSCLNLIIDELIKTKELLYLDEYLKDNLSTQTWTNWLTNVLIRKPLLWSVNSLISTNTNDNKTLVHYKVIQEESQTLFNKIPQNKLNKLINLQQLFEIIDEDVGLIGNVKLLLYHLKQQKKVDFTIIDNNQSNDEMLNFLIKFGQTSLKPITEIDISIYNLEQNERRFIQFIEELEDEINKILKDIKIRLTTGHRQLAKANLKKKHELQKRLDRKLNALHNIQILLEKLRDIHEDAQLWGSYKQALAAFNKTFKETGLSEDKVEDTILELEEVLEISNDIQNVLTKPVINTTTEDDELEKELQQLLEDEQQTNENIDDLSVELANLKLPEVPVTRQNEEETAKLPPSQSS